MKYLVDYFPVPAGGSNIRAELIGGLTTFLAMAYITIVNPGMLSETGMDFGAVFVATCLAGALQFWHYLVVAAMLKMFDIAGYAAYSSC